jgi:membrane protein DedA with SNARE-associated domain
VASTAKIRRVTVPHIAPAGYAILKTARGPHCFHRTGRRLPSIRTPGVLATFFHPSSYLGLFVFLTLTGCGMPIPEEVALVLAGVLSNQGVLRPEFALLACILGTLAGDSVTYAIGYHWGRNLVENHPRLSKMLHAENGKRFEAAVNSHAFKMMFVSRFIVGVRATVYVTAGVVRVPYRRFLMYDVVCVSVMVSIVFFLAYCFGDDVLNWVRRAEWTATLAVAAVVVVVGIVLYRRRGAVVQAILDQESSGG